MLDELLDGGSASVDLDWTRQGAAAIDRAAWQVGRLYRRVAGSQPSERARLSLEARCQREQERLLDAQGRALSLGAWLTVKDEPNATDRLPAAEPLLYEQWRKDWVGPAAMGKLELRRRY